VTPIERAQAELMKLAASVSDRDPGAATARLLERVAARDDADELRGALLIAGALAHLLRARSPEEPADPASLRILNPEA
jgi:hypothetical protein